MVRPLGFVDREAEVVLFEQYLRKDVPQRVLAFAVKPRHGKTLLLRYFDSYCRQHGVPVALVDFDERQGGAVSYWKFIQRVCDQLDRQQFSEVDDCEARSEDHGPLVSIHTGEGSPTVDFGARMRIESSDVQRISGRDQIQFGDVTYHARQDDARALQEERMYKMGRAFCRGLDRICSKQTAVLLLDTFERVASETQGWLAEWLFPYTLASHRNLIIVVAGRPAIHDFLEEPSSWRTLRQVRDVFDPPREADIREFAKDQGIVIPEGEISSWVRYGAHKMALLGELAEAHRRFAYG